MTAVQQYWLVENERYLVSSLYPVLVRPGDTVAAGECSVSQRATPWGLEYVVAGEVGVVSAATIAVVRTLYNLHDTGDRMNAGEVTVVSGATTTVVRTQYNPYDTANAMAAGETNVISGVTTQVVKLYDSGHRGDNMAAGETTVVAASRN